MSTLSNATKHTVNLFSSATIEQYILRQQGIVEAFVTTINTAQACFKAYVVVAPGFNHQHLRQKLQTEFGAQSDKIWVAEITRLPRDKHGLVDDRQLHKVSACDPYHLWNQVEGVGTIRLSPSDTNPDLQSYNRYARQLFLESVDTERATINSSVQNEAVLGSEQASPSEFQSLADTLVMAAQTEQGVEIYSDKQSKRLDYNTILSNASLILGGIRKAGVGKGQYVLILCDKRECFILAFWACILGGIIPIPVGTSMVIKDDSEQVRKLHHVHASLSAAAMLVDATSEAQIAGLSEASMTALPPVLSIDKLSNASNAIEFTPGESDDIALVLLTSGSTGIPKMVPQTHRAVLHQIEQASLTLGLSEQDKSLNWFPLDHVGGLVMFHVRDVRNCMEQVQVATEAVLTDISCWLSLMSKHKITITWAPNFAFALVSEYFHNQECSDAWDLSNLRTIMNAGEAIIQSIIGKFLLTLGQYNLPIDSIVYAWGMSETCSAVTYHRVTSEDTLQSQNVRLGKPIPGVIMKLVDPHGNTISDHKTGRLLVSGPCVTNGYLSNPSENNKSFSNGWLATGDLGRFVDGELVIEGRDKDVVNINGNNISCHDVEHLIEQLDCVKTSYSAACAIRNRSEDSDRLLLFFVHEPGQGTVKDALRRIRDTLIEQMSIFVEFVLPVTTAQVPKTSIGKIQRSKLLKQFYDGEFIALLSIYESESKIAQYFWKNTALKPIWFEKALLTHPLQEAESLNIIFTNDKDSLGFSEKDTVIVESGDRFFHDGGDWFCVNVTAPADVEQVFRRLQYRFKGHISLLFLWSLSSEESKNEPTAFVEGAGLLLSIVQAASKVQSAQVSILIATRDKYWVTCGDVINPSLSVYDTFLCLNDEIDNINLKVVDFDQVSYLRWRELLRQELVSTNAEREVSYRRGQRYVSGFEKVALGEMVAESTVLKTGFYLIVGATGGIGRLLCEYLLRHSDLQILAIGRSSQDRELDVELLRAAREEKKYFFQRADATDHQQVFDAVGRAENFFDNSIAGIFNLVATYNELPVTDMSLQDLVENRDPKIKSTLVLDEVLTKKGGGIFVHWSSALKYTFGANIGTYVSSNAFVEAFSHYQNTRGNNRAFSFAWGSWHGIGMNKATKLTALLERKGIVQESEEAAFVKMFACIKCDIRHAVFGLDENNIYVRPRVNSAPIQAPSVHVLCETGLLSTVVLTGAEGEPIAYQSTVLAKSVANSPQTVAPLSSTEKQLQKIWCDILKTELVDPTDNFFDLGGDSLKLARLLRKINDSFGKTFELTLLLSNPTIVEQSNLISNGAPALTNKVNYLIPLQKHGEKSPFFGVHPFFGLIYPYLELANAVKGDRPFYAIQAKGLKYGEKPWTTIADMANAYIEAIKEVQPHGPYFLGGWSMGSLVAFEMAKTLKARGEKVAALVIIDQAVDSVDKFFESVPLRIQIQKLGSVIHSAWESYEPASGKEKSSNPLFQLRRSWRFGYNILVPMLKVALYNKKALGDFQLTQYKGEITLIHTGDPEFTHLQTEDLGWSDIATEGVKVYRVKGDHFNLHKKPYVNILAEQFKAAMKDIEQSNF